MRILDRAKSQGQLLILRHFVNTCTDLIIKLKVPHVSQNVNTSRSTRKLCVKSQSSSQIESTHNRQVDLDLHCRSNGLLTNVQALFSI